MSMRMQEHEIWVLPDSSPLLTPGDRFIPNRSLMDIPMAQSLLMGEKFKKKPEEPLTPARAEYRKRLEETLMVDLEGRPFKMMVFRGSSKNLKSNSYDWQQGDGPLSSRDDTYKRLLLFDPYSPEEILDAPGLEHDYYTNLMDWGASNILAVALGPSLYLLDMKTKKVSQLFKSKDHTDHPSSIAWSPTGKHISIGFRKSKIEIWDVGSQKLMRVLEGHKKQVGCLSWNANVLSSGSKDTCIINHDVRSPARSRILHKAHSERVCGLKWSSCGRFLASGGNDNILHIWDSYTMGSSKYRYLHRLTDHAAAVKALAWSPFNSNLLASGGGSMDRCIKLWNVQAGRCTQSINTDSQVCALEWSRHQKELLSAHGYSQNQLSLWSYPSMSKIVDLKGHTSRVLYLAQSPDGRKVASGAGDETIRLWKLFEPPPAMYRRKHDEESCRDLSGMRAHIR